MPQLDPEIFSPQLVWLALSFVVLYLLMARVALPRIGEVLEARQERIAHDLDAAATLKNEAETVLAEYEQAMAKARADAQGVLAQAAEQRAGEADARRAELDARIAGQLGEAETRIAAAKRAAIANLEVVAGDIARAATEKLIGERVDDAAVEAALAAAAKGEA
ncbi:MAG: F0F1 ATP synthase subunit B' [Alphaproteobacteria bacterium]